MKESNGWRKGYDPVQRWLRVVTVLVVLSVFVYLVISDNDGVRDLPTLSLALGAVLLLLGYEGIVSLPFISHEDKGRQKGREDDSDDRS